MPSIRSLIESLGIFERNKVPLELKMLGQASYARLKLSRPFLTSKKFKSLLMLPKTTWKGA
jgi:hypothetical protein